MGRTALHVKEVLTQLPLWAHVLVASRVVRRGAMAMLACDAALLAQALAVCEAIERCAAAGCGTRDARAAFDAAAALPETPLPATAAAAAHALRWTVDAARAAESALDFPVDDTVTRSALAAMAALAQDPRVSSLQLAVLAAADLDQIRFACGEIRLGRYDGLTDHVLCRLAPVHPLTLTEPTPTPEEQAR